MDFRNALVFDIEAMMKQGAIDSPARLFEAIIAFARSVDLEPSVEKTDNSQGFGAVGQAALTAIAESLPESFRETWERGTHYRLRNLSPGAPGLVVDLPKLFISYRRADSQDVVGRIYDNLEPHFSKERIFRDLDSIPLGVTFPDAIWQAIHASDVALIVIGPTWATVADSKGRKRLDDPRDFVRVEVELALESGIPVIPVLVSGATMPGPDQMPSSLQFLTYFNAAQVRPDPDFHADIGQLMRKLRRIPICKDQASEAPIPRRRKPWWQFW